MAPWQTLLRKTDKNGNDTATIGDTVERLRKKFFIKGNKADRDTKRTAMTKKQMEGLEVTTEEVKEMIKASKPNKAPGPDKITNNLLKGVQDTIAEEIAKVYTEAIRQGRWPQ